MPGPKQVHLRACKEISANGKFEEEYLKVHGPRPGNYTYNFANLRSNMINMRPPG